MRALLCPLYRLIHITAGRRWMSLIVSEPIKENIAYYREGDSGCEDPLSKTIKENITYYIWWERQDVRILHPKQSEKI